MHELSLSDINGDLVRLRSWIEYVRPAGDDTVSRMERVRRLLPKLPPLERDVVELHFFHGKPQEQIGEILGLTQQAVSHRMRRALSRLAFLIDHPELTVPEVQRDLRAIWPGAPSILSRLITYYARTSSQQRTAAQLRVTTRAVRVHLAQASEVFKTTPGPLALRYATMLDRLQANRSILCEVAKGSYGETKRRFERRASRHPQHAHA